MLVSLLNFNWISILLVVITCFLVVNNRAFSKKIRIEFYISFVLCLYLSLSAEYFNVDSMSQTQFTNTLLMVTGVVTRVAVIGLFVHLFLKVKRDSVDYIFAGVMILILFIAIASEGLASDKEAVADTLSVIICILYYYGVMQTYKKDNLTGLPIRHSLNYEMEDIAGKEYNVVLIDVDNFKLINDRYGHEKGDETLVAVVKAINKNLLPGSRMYRYGGDEFVIISRKVSVDKLASSLDAANEYLSENDMHFSYGISVHKPGDDGSVAITEADEKMYDNKKELKGDGVWDSMTGLFNYHGFLSEIHNFRKHVEANGNELCLIAVDVDRLSSINMAYGYIEGNFVIKTLAELLESALNGKGIACHLNGDEFVVALEVGEDSNSVIMNYVENIEDKMEKASNFADVDYSIKLNFGVYTAESGNKTSDEELINNVLYVKQEEKDARHKNDSRDNKDYDEAEEKVVLDIIDNNRLKYVFQPIVSAVDGEIVAYESLMRSDTEQMVSPITILKYAERNNRLYDIEKYTFANVLKKLTDGNILPDGRQIFINSIPGYMLEQEEYEELRDKYGDLFSRMVVEITEQNEIDDNALADINMRRSKDGFSLAIDDYGSGYSNTNSLLRYMPQIIKLDRLLITGIERNAKKQFFVNSIISFARENDMKILAEGVETEAELKTLIRLGIDMIQGYYTAKPEFEMLEEIPADIKKVIIEENLKVGDNKRMVYTVAENCELSSVRLAMEDYSKINVSAEYVTIVGSDEYTADMVIRIKDGINCNMTLTDVRLNSVDDEPCIDIGEDANLVLNLEGHNRLNLKGIHVPEGSSLTVIGNGDLDVMVKGHDCYAIGTDSENKVGVINMNSSGKVNIIVDGELCTGIGGGFATEHSQVNVNSGSFNIRVAGVDAVGVGVYSGEVPIKIKDSELNVEFRVNTGIVIGTLNGRQDIDISNFNLNIVGSGTNVSGVGSISDNNGDIRLKSGVYKIKLNGQKLHLLGASGGELNIIGNHVRFDMIGEGDNVLGFGSFDSKSHLSVDECSVELVINASNPHGFGIVEKPTEVGFRGALTVVRINGESQIIGQ